MTKKELKDYNALKISIEQNKQLLAKYQDDAKSVPVIVDKVQASQKDYPYILVHQVVEAKDPVKYGAIKENITKIKQILYNQIEEESKRELDILEFANSLSNVRDRYIIKAVYLEDKDQKDVAIALDLTEGRVSQIIREIIDNLN